MKHLNIELVEFDNGSTPESMAAYVLVSGLTKKELKDKGSAVLDVGNFIYRKYGIQYEHPPEFHRSSEPKDSIAFYISKKRMEKMPHILKWLVANYNQNKPAEERLSSWECALYYARRLTIQKKEDVSERERSTKSSQQK